jgi:diguanylate cyclase (GGDEF)-like protein/PAS domain S-box-containing protein
MVMRRATSVARWKAAMAEVLWFRRLMAAFEQIFALAALAAVRSTGYGGHAPLWISAVLFLFSSAFRQPEVERWVTGRESRWLTVLIGVHTATAVGLAYLTGWGPVFMPIALAAILGMWLEYTSSRVCRSFMVWGLVWGAAGQAGIALGWIPTYIPEPRVHALAVLTATSMVVLVMVLQRSASGRERREVEKEGADAERLEAERQLRASERRFKALVHNASDIVQTLDATGIVTYVSPAVEAIMGYRPEDVVGRNGMSFIHPDDLPMASRTLAGLAQDASLITRIEVRLRHADGSWHWHEAQGRNLLADPAIGALVVNQRDISERKILEEELRFQASHDVLTGLPNRALFNDRLEHAIGRQQRSGEILAVMLLDLDDFKSVNDTLGHQAGDLLLLDVAASLRTATRPRDSVCRLGGDEFAVLLEDLPDRDAAEVAATRVFESFTGVLRSAQRVTDIGASAGVTFSLSGSVSASDMLREADLAMYAAKAAGKGTHRTYEPDMHPPAGNGAHAPEVTLLQ